MRTLSLAALSALELSPEALIATAESIGYDAVGLRLIPATPTEMDYQILSNKALQAACKHRLADSRVVVEDIEILRVLPDTNIAEFERVLNLGAELGAKSALVALDDADVSRADQHLRELAALAKPYGILPHLEFMPWLSVSTLGQAVDRVHAVGDDNLTVLVDSFHFNRSQSDWADWARYTGTPPRYVQLCDTPTSDIPEMPEILRQARADRRIPGEGYMSDMPDMVKMFPNAALSLEIPGANLPQHDALRRAEAIYTRTREWLARHHLED